MAAHRRFLLVVASTALVSAACSWGMLGHDAGRSGFSPFERGLTPAGIAGAHELWRTRPGTSPSAPVVADGRVLVTTQHPSEVSAFAAAGGPGCSPAGDPCTPLWSNVRPRIEGHDVPISAPVVVNDRAYVGGSYVDLPPTSPYDVWFADVGASFDTATGAVVGGGSGAGTAATTNALYFQTKIAVTGYIPRFAVYDVLTVKTLDGSTNRFLTAGGGGAPAVGDGRVVRTVGTSLEVYDAAGVEFCGNDPIFPVVGYACEPLWRGELPAGVALDARPTVAHGHAFVPLLHGSVVAFRTAGCGAATCAPE